MRPLIPCSRPNLIFFLGPFLCRYFCFGWFCYEEICKVTFLIEDVPMLVLVLHTDIVLWGLLKEGDSYQLALISVSIHSHSYYWLIFFLLYQCVVGTSLLFKVYMVSEPFSNLWLSCSSFSHCNHHISFVAFIFQTWTSKSTSTLPFWHHSYLSFSLLFYRFG